MAYLTRAALLLIVFIFSALVVVQPAGAQALPKYLNAGESEATLKDTKNAWTVGLVGGLFEGTFMRFAEEIRKAIDDADNMRVLPIVSRGSASNLEDLLYLRGVDVAVTQVDVFEYFRLERKIANLQDRIHYITRFPMAELHLITRKEITSIEQLRGKRVDFAAAGGAGTITGVVALQRLGIRVEQVTGDLSGGTEALRKGNVDGILRVVQKPVGYISSIPANSGLHLLSIPYAKFGDIYALGEFTNADYPNLVAPGEVVDTIAVPSVLAVYNWPKNTDRYRRVERFVQRLFANFNQLQKPPYHPKWKDVNLAASIPGWTRFSVAEAELQRLKVMSEGTSDDLQRDFRLFVSQNVKDGGGSASRENVDELFRKFMQWREQRGAPPR
jgi:uncharacterized protein